MPTAHDIELEQQRLYESGIVDELDDDEASALLAWGEARIAAFAKQASDDPAFEAACDDLSQLLKYTNRYAGRRADEDAEFETKYLGYINRYAVALGYPTSIEQLQAAVPADAGDRMGTVTAITSVLDAANAPATTAASAPAAPTTNDEPFPNQHDDPFLTLI